MKTSFVLLLAIALAPLALSWLFLFLRARKRAKVVPMEEHATFMGDMSAFHRMQHRDPDAPRRS